MTSGTPESTQNWVLPGFQNSLDLASMSPLEAKAMSSSATVTSASGGHLAPPPPATAASLGPVLARLRHSASAPWRRLSGPAIPVPLASAPRTSAASRLRAFAAAHPRLGARHLSVRRLVQPNKYRM